MAKAPIRLIATDIDGTLLNPRFEIDPADRDALIRAHNSGIEVVVVTGRRHTFAMPIVRQLGFELCVISSNGAVTRSASGQTFHRHLMTSGVARRLCTSMRAFSGQTVITFDKDAKGAIVIERMEQLTSSIRRWMEKNSDFIEIIAPLEDALKSDPVQVMFCGSMSRMAQALVALQDAGLDSEITVLRTEYPDRDLSMIDVLAAGCSKGHALERWARHRGLDRTEVMAIGDNHNDVEMLEFAGHPVIMENACEELRQRGWHVTASNGHCGVAAAVDRAMAML